MSKQESTEISCLMVSAGPFYAALDHRPAASSWTLQVLSKLHLAVMLNKS